MILAVILFAIVAASLPATPITPSTLSAVLEIADASGVPRSVARQLCIEESGDWRTGTLGDATAKSKLVRGYRSRGLFQLYEEPANLGYLLAQYWPGERFDIDNPIHNATVALRYLADLHRRFGTWFLAACAYNWGPGNLAGIKRLEDVPAETRAYAARIINAK